MKSISLKWKKVWIISGVTLATIVILLIALISPLAKYIVEKYDEQWTGRQITMDWAYVNPFTGFVHFHNLKALEVHNPDGSGRGDTLFLTAEGVSADFALLKLFSGIYEVSELRLDHPRGTVVQRGRKLNFDDLILRFSPDKLHPKSTRTKVNILNIKIEHGEFYYREKVIPIFYVIRDLNLESSGVRWNADTIATKFSFLSQNQKGGMKGDFTIDTKSLDYRITTTVRNFDLEIIRQYLWELINYGMFSAQLDGHLVAKGNFRNKQNITTHGRLAFRDFHLGKTIKDDYASFKKLDIVIDEFSPINKKFLFDSIILVHPFVKYEKYDSLNNIEMLFGKNGSNISDVTSQAGRFNLVIELGRYLKDLSREFFKSQYRINRLSVSDAEVDFNDFSLNEQFAIGATKLNIEADSVDKHRNRVNIKLKSGVKPYGDLTVSLSIDPKDSADFDMVYHLNHVPLTVFNPYVISYSSFPLDRGRIEMEGVWNVRKGEINSVNHLLVIDPRASKRIKNKDLRWIPLPLIMSLVKERGNAIDYEIPIRGNLKNPHFHLGDVLTDLVKNIVVKPVTIPYAVTLRSVENEIDNALTLRWNMRQHMLLSGQRKFVTNMARFLEDNDEASISVYPETYASKEREYILFFEAKKKYFLHTHPGFTKSLSTSDSVYVDMMSIKDPAFMRALKVGRGAGDTVMFSIQDKCSHFVGQKIVNVRYNQLLSERQKEFNSFFIRDATKKRMTILDNQPVVPFNGFSCYNIRYAGDIPKSLRRAYEEMHDLSSESMRKKYSSENDAGKRPALVLK